LELIANDLAGLEGLPIFAGLAMAVVYRLLSFASIGDFAPGTLLFEEGEQPQVLYVMIKGIAEMFSTLEGRDCGVMLMNPGDVFVPAAVLFGTPYATSARTMARCRMLLIDAEAVRAEAARTAQFGMHLSRAIAGQFRLAVREVIDLKTRTAAQRLASFLLRVIDSSDAPAPALPMRKRDLAARIGMTPETLSRSFQILADNGLLVRGKQIIVKDRARIERFCGPGRYRSDTEDLLQVKAL
jgi:CRP/FNR family transcriptional regulator, transcriptional activator FtrB